MDDSVRVLVGCAAVIIRLMFLLSQPFSPETHKASVRLGKKQKSMEFKTLADEFEFEAQLEREIYPEDTEDYYDC